MRNRIPTQVIKDAAKPGYGAVRKGFYNENGDFLRHEWVKVEDEPSVEGTPLNKLTLLTDATAALLELQQTDPTVDDAFRHIKETTYTKQEDLGSVVRLVLGLPADATPNDALFELAKRSGGGYPVEVYLVTNTGRALSGVTISGALSLSGGTLKTNASGYALGVSTVQTVTISSPTFLDVAGASQRVTLSTREITRVDLRPVQDTSGYRKITTSTTLTFSPLVADVDLCIIGGGGGGGSGGGGGGSLGSSYKAGTGGGGGSIFNALKIVPTPLTPYSFVIGAGGSVEQPGGTSSAMGYSAVGGARGQFESTYYVTNGAAATVYEFGETGRGLPGGGGGGSGAFAISASDLGTAGTGGAPCGAAGGRGTTAGRTGLAPGGGGGGGSGRSSGFTLAGSAGVAGSGGRGQINVRWRNK